MPAAQAAHEAIRPTHPELAEVPVDDHAQQVLYKLIWRRAAQSQMAPATTDVRKVTLALDAEPTRIWAAEQAKTRFAGWKVLERAVEGRAAAEEAAWTAWQPSLVPGTVLTWTSLAADEQFTKPRGRYTEASLVAELEKRGIGRPSTFATLLSTIQDREYVEKTNDEGTSRDSHHLTIRPSQWPPTETLQTHKVGAERNKLRATALGRSVATFLSREYDDLFNYDFTAGMEADLDNISRGTAPWKALLQRTWDTYKERYTDMTSRSGEGVAAAKAARQRDLAEGLKVILSRKGPLLVRDPPAGSAKSVKATFASLPAGKTFETVSAADAAAAFAAAAAVRAGDLLGHLEGDEIRKKKGPYGLYAECKGARVPLKGDEDLARIQEKLVAKISFAASGDAFERKVGDFTIKRGPYGFYFYKHALKRVRFVKFPVGVEPTTATAADLTAAYAAPSRGGGGARGGRGGARGGKKAAGGAVAAAVAPEEEE